MILKKKIRIALLVLCFVGMMELKNEIFKLLWQQTQSVLALGYLHSCSWEEKLFELKNTNVLEQTEFFLNVLFFIIDVSSFGKHLLCFLAYRDREKLKTKTLFHKSYKYFLISPFCLFWLWTYETFYLINFKMQCVFLRKKSHRNMKCFQALLVITIYSIFFNLVFSFNFVTDQNFHYNYVHLIH